MNQWYHRPDFEALRKRANDNLVLLAAGEVRKRIEAEEEIARRAKEERKISLKARTMSIMELHKERAALKNELFDLETIYEEYERAYYKPGATTLEKGAFEEIDHRRDQIYERLSVIEDDLFTLIH